MLRYAIGMRNAGQIRYRRAKLGPPADTAGFSGVGFHQDVNTHKTGVYTRNSQFAIRIDPIELESMKESHQKTWRKRNADHRPCKATSEVIREARAPAKAA